LISLSIEGDCAMEIRKIKKLDRIKNNLETNKYTMRCPKCFSRFDSITGNSLICKSKHCFDISKKGYINFLKINKSDIYNRELFQARNSVYTYGVYNALFKEISDIVTANIKSNSISRILDAGSGEGYLLNYLSKIKQISDKTNLIGADITKEAIKISAMDEENILWCVTDLSNLPIMDKKIGIILNVLSPANYSEFKRILNPLGIVIKVVPEEGYLKEIRRNLTGYIEKESYSNEKIVNKFEENLELVYEKKIKYTVKIDKKTLKDLLKMTPMTSNIPPKKLEDILESNINEITIDLKLLIGKQKMN
jgi:23S rRNA (guanine745-N1)-methyltransferase